MGRPKGSKNKPKPRQTPEVLTSENQPLKIATVVFSNYLAAENWIDSSGKIFPELEDAILKAQDETIPHNEAIRPLCDMLVEHLEEVGITPRAAYFARHLQDVELQSKGSSIVKRTKIPHLHMVISVNTDGRYNKNSTRYPISQWAEGLFCREHIVCKQRKGRDAYNNALSYLIHAKDPDKTQYEPQDVYTARGTNYLEIWHNNKDRWTKGCVTKQKSVIVTEEAVDDLVFKIIDDGLTRQELFLNREYCYIYAYNRSKIDNAFTVAEEARVSLNKSDFDNGKFATSVFFFFGASASGKTTYAKMLAKKIVAWAKNALDRRWLIYTADSKTPLDSYQGEEIMLLNDTKQNDFDIGEWLNLLDPYSEFNAHARFRNKRSIVPRVIIITSTQNPMQYFLYVKNRTDEAVNQFFRRIQKVVEIKNTDYVQDFASKPTDENTTCSIYKRVRFDCIRRIEVYTKEFVKKNRVKMCLDPNDPPAVKTDVSFELEPYPYMLQPTAMIELLLKDVAVNHHMDYELSAEAKQSLEFSAWFCDTEKRIGEDMSTMANPFAHSSPDADNNPEVVGSNPAPGTAHSMPLTSGNPTCSTPPTMPQQITEEDALMQEPPAPESLEFDRNPFISYDFGTGVYRSTRREDIDVGLRLKKRKRG